MLYFSLIYTYLQGFDLHFIIISLTNLDSFAMSKIRKHVAYNQQYISLLFLFIFQVCNNFMDLNCFLIKAHIRYLNHHQC